MWQPAVVWVGPRVKREPIDEQRHGRLPSNAGSIEHQRPKGDLSFLRVNAEDNELLSFQATLETLVVEFVLVWRKPKLLFAVVSDPLSRSLGPETGQVSFEGAQRLLLKVGGLYGHVSMVSNMVWSPPSSSLPKT